MSTHMFSMNKEDLYAILGCPSTASTEQILSEYRARVRGFHPDKQNGMDKEFCQLQRAKEILTDPSKRKHYDTYVAMGVGISLNEWMEQRERLQQTLHWANPPASTPAIEPNDNISLNEPAPAMWKRHENPTVNAFRSYQI